jgi:hypothetical protein
MYSPRRKEWRTEILPVSKFAHINSKYFFFI